MSNINAVLTQRLNRGEKSSKMAEMAKQSANGSLTSFSGVFSVSELTDKEKHFLEELLKNYAVDDEEIEQDLEQLLSLTAEVKAITNQAILLHGERIKKAHDILTRYRDGAFTAWMMTAYGNRQTPYNLMQYYQFWETLPKPIRPKIEHMPRQAIYTLASREGPINKKIDIVNSYKGETKAELLLTIREAFPLDNEDKRGHGAGDTMVSTINRLLNAVKKQKKSLSKSHKQTLIQCAHLLIDILEH